MTGRCRRCSRSASCRSRPRRRRLARPGHPPVRRGSAGRRPAAARHAQRRPLRDGPRARRPAVEQVDPLAPAPPSTERAGHEDEAAGLLRDAVELAGDRRDLADELAGAPAVAPPTSPPSPRAWECAWRGADGRTPSRGPIPGGPPGRAGAGRPRRRRRAGRHRRVDGARRGAARRVPSCLRGVRDRGQRAAVVAARRGDRRGGPPGGRRRADRGARCGRGAVGMHPGVTGPGAARARSVPADEVPVPVSEAAAFATPWSTTASGTATRSWPATRHGRRGAAPVGAGGGPGAIRRRRARARAGRGTRGPEHGRAIHLSMAPAGGCRGGDPADGPPVPVGYGQHVPASDLAAYGQELAGTRGTEGQRVTVVADVPSGTWHYMAFTTAPEGGVRGRRRCWRSCTGRQAAGAATRLRVRAGLGLARRQQPRRRGVERGPRRITRRQYNGGAGGFRAPARPGPDQFTVRVVVTGADGREVRSVAAVATVAAEPPAARVPAAAGRLPLAPRCSLRGDAHQRRRGARDARSCWSPNRGRCCRARRGRTRSWPARCSTSAPISRRCSPHPCPAQETVLAALFPARAPRRAPPGTSCRAAGGDVMPIRHRLPVLLPAHRPGPAGLQCLGRGEPGGPGARPSGRDAASSSPASARRRYPSFPAPAPFARRAACPRLQGDVRGAGLPPVPHPAPSGVRPRRDTTGRDGRQQGRRQDRVPRVLYKELTRNVRRRFQADVRLSGDHLPVGATVGPPRAWIENYETSAVRRARSARGHRGGQDGRRVPLVVEWRAPRNLLGERRYRTTVLSFYDAAGEDFITRDSTRPAYLRRADGLIAAPRPVAAAGRAARGGRAGGRGHAARSGPSTCSPASSALLRSAPGASAAKQITVPLAVVFAKMDALFPMLQRENSPLLHPPDPRKKGYDEQAGQDTHHQVAEHAQQARRRRHRQPPPGHLPHFPVLRRVGARRAARLRCEEGRRARGATVSR